MMRTTLDISEELIAEAMALTNTKNKNQLIRDELAAGKRLIALKGTAVTIHPSGYPPDWPLLPGWPAN